MIVTIDGLAGSGKSSAAKAFAEAIGFEFLPTGKMYRAVALLLLDAAVPMAARPRDVNRIAHLLSEVRFEFPATGTTVLNGVDYSARLRSPEATAASSLCAEFPEVRVVLKREQQRIAQGRRFVAEGRDLGTAVFPEAPLKFFFTADIRVRALRRQAEEPTRTLAEVTRDLLTRDATDSSRECDPLLQPADAIIIDTTELKFPTVLAQLQDAYSACAARPC